jgi:hypothetical protein
VLSIPEEMVTDLRIVKLKISKIMQTQHNLT